MQQSTEVLFNANSQEKEIEIMPYIQIEAVNCTRKSGQFFGGLFGTFEL